ncbi:hypothetical protein FI667_g9826, partial [Globisporangium splendens]
MPNHNVYAFLDEMVREYEEKLVLQLAAQVFSENKRGDVVPNVQVIRLLTDQFLCGTFPRQAVLKLVAKYDVDESGALDAQEMLQLMRHLNYSTGCCDECYEPIGEGEHGYRCMNSACYDVGYYLCSFCYTNRHRSVHRSHLFSLVSGINDEAVFPPGTGSFLMGQVTSLFSELDADNSGTVTHKEFRIHFREQGFQEALIDHLLQFDLDGDGMISIKELTYLVVGLSTTRVCHECHRYELVGSKCLKSCLECTAGYNICNDCYKTNRRHNHPHSLFKYAETFQLCETGLFYQRQYDGTLELRVADRRLFDLYGPFIQDKMQRKLVLGGTSESSKSPQRQRDFKPRTSYAAEDVGASIGKGIGEYLAAEYLSEDNQDASASAVEGIGRIAGVVADIFLPGVSVLVWAGIKMLKGAFKMYWKMASPQKKMLKAASTY